LPVWLEMDKFKNIFKREAATVSDTETIILPYSSNYTSFVIQPNTVSYRPRPSSHRFVNRLNKSVAMEQEGGVVKTAHLLVQLRMQRFAYVESLHETTLTFYFQTSPNLCKILDSYVDS